MSFLVFTPTLSTPFTREVAEVILRVIRWGMAVEALVRGIDYASGDGPTVTQSLTFIESVAPLWFWGAIGIAVGALTGWGMLRERYEPMIAGASLGCALYLTFAVGLAVTVYERGWPPDGYRTPGMFLVWSGIWLLLSIEMFVGRDAARTVLTNASHDATSGDDRR